jgi:single-strand DNA-binding protein
MTICGNLGGAPELRFTADGTPVCNFSVAVSRYRGPERDAATDWYRVSVWRDMGENAAESLSKGDRVIVFGALSSREVENEDGTKRTYWDLTAEYLGPDLRFDTAQVTKTNPAGDKPKTNTSQTTAYYPDEEPF